MSFQTEFLKGLKFELEHTNTTVRTFNKEGERFFDFTLIAAGQNIVRVIAGSGEFSQRMMYSIGELLLGLGYLIAKYEHGHDEVLIYDLVTKKLIERTNDKTKI